MSDSSYSVTRTSLNKKWRQYLKYFKKNRPLGGAKIQTDPHNFKSAEYEEAAASAVCPLESIKERRWAAHFAASGRHLHISPLHTREADRERRDEIDKT